MAGIWFKPENSQGCLVSPHTDYTTDEGFYPTRKIYFYARLYIDDSHADELMYLASVLCNFSLTPGSYRYRTYFYIEARKLKFLSMEYSSWRAGGGTVDDIPVGEIVEIAVTAATGRGNDGVHIFVNGVQVGVWSSVNNKMYCLYGHKTVMLGTDENYQNPLKGVLLLDMALWNDWYDQGTPPAGSTSTIYTLWNADFEDFSRPVDIATSRNSVSSQLTFTNNDPENVVWNFADSPPSSGGGSGGIVIPGNGNTTRIQGTIKEDNLAVARQVFAITQAQLEETGSDVTKHAVLDSVTSDENNGSYSLDTSPYEGEVMVLAMDDFGQAWQPDTTYAAGDVIRPPTFQGYVYHCTQAGTTDSTEPTWWFDIESSQPIGTALFEAKPYSRPLAHGPITPEIVPES